MTCKFQLRSCCPSLNPDCNQVSPVIQTTINPPTGLFTDDGIFTGTIVGLFTRFNVNWSDGVQQTVDGVIFRDDLAPGDYTIAVQSLVNPECIWNYEIRIPDFTEFFVELFYLNLFTTPVPVVPNAAPIPGIEPENIRWNNDRIIGNNFDPNNQPFTFNQCFQLVIQGGVPPYNIVWQDFQDPNYVLPPALNVAPTIQQPANPDDPQGPVRPPVLASPNGNEVMCFNLVPNNGNGWVNVTIQDSTVPAQGGPNEVVFWLYLLENVLP